MRSANLFIFLFLLCINAIVNAQQINVFPKKPLYNKEVRYTWTLPKKYLDKKNPDSLKIEVILLGGKLPVKTDIALPAKIKNGQDFYHYEYNFKGDSNTHAIGIFWDKLYDQSGIVNNYISPFYVSEKPVQYAYGTLANLYSNPNLAKIKADTLKALQLLDIEKKNYPLTFNRFIIYYASLVRTNNVKAGEIKNWILNWLKSDKLKEEDFAKAQQAFDFLGDKDKADSTQNIISQKFPYGTHRKMQLSELFRKEKTTDIGKLVNSTLLEIKGNDIDALQIKSFIYNLAAWRYLQNNDPKNYTKYIANVDLQMAKSANKAFAQKLIAADTLTTYAEKFAFSYFNAEEENYKKANQRTLVNKSDSIMLQSAKKNYADAAILYSTALIGNKKISEGLKYSRLAADSIYLGTNYDYNDKYLLSLKQYEKPEVVLEQIEKFIRLGNTSRKVKELADSIYAKINTTSVPFSIWYTSITKDDMQERRKILEKMIQNNKAPQFALLDISGKKVALADFKDKVVVLDFWATWCVPCLNSFAAMQKTVNQFAKDTSVVFLFVDTREAGNDIKAKTEKSISFITKKLSQYTFKYLFDSTNQVLSSYGARAIPAKFIIDGTGVIRFTTQGYNNNDEELIKELTQMIQISKEKSFPGINNK